MASAALDADSRGLWESTHPREDGAEWWATGRGVGGDHVPLVPMLPGEALESRTPVE